MPSIKSEEVVHLEKLMDGCQNDLKPLEEFILPTGGPVTAMLHLARTVSRRAERLCVRLNRKERLDPEILKYLNRLSDAFFVLARWMGLAQGERETLWKRIG
jgi:cob(I)alamin adenosyltransferase